MEKRKREREKERKMGKKERRQGQLVSVYLLYSTSLRNRKAYLLYLVGDSLQHT